MENDLQPIIALLAYDWVARLPFNRNLTLKTRLGLIDKQLRQYRLSATGKERMDLAIMFQEQLELQRRDRIVAATGNPFVQELLREVQAT